MLSTRRIQTIIEIFKNSKKHKGSGDSAAAFTNNFGRQVVDDQVEEDELESRQLPVQAECGWDSAQWRALRDEITSRSSASHRGAPRSPGCDQRSCDLAKATETVTLRVSPQGVTVKLGAEAC